MASVRYCDDYNAPNDVDDHLVHVPDGEDTEVDDHDDLDDRLRGLLAVEYISELA